MDRKQNAIAGIIDGKKLKIAIVVSKFNPDITGKMFVGAVETLRKNGVLEKNIQTVWVPGAFEIPLACQRLAQTKKYDGLVALGCVIKGDTDHYHYVSDGSIHGVMDVMLKTDLPIGLGIITTVNLKQAQERSSGRHNKGAEAAQAVLEMINNQVK
ncbi:MAG: 6,7-dimethyl-8-ribityllumazine synthase [Candidatus Moranbacteria bacterium]|nr:6,7-dimethyl-8-ribityllumazine synthase [bacterium]MDP1833471.1 6,7-dimethyl-8-ribityllumazine synthase [Candidatus Moranbacteria bacterium]